MSSGSKKDNATLLEDFILTYRDHPCLWRYGSREYNDRAKKEIAYGILLDKYKLIDPNADRDTVVKKINILRTNYRKQKRKVEEYARAGEVYKPTQWYYHLFDFLDEIDLVKNANKDYSVVFNDLNGDEFLQEETGGYSSENSMQDSKECIRTYSQDIGDASNSEHETQVRNKTLTVTPQISKKNSYRMCHDRYDLFGKNVTLKLKDIQDNTQRLLAEKIINDALFYAEMGQLTMSHKLVKETDNK